MDWSSDATSVGDEKLSPFCRYVLPEPWQARRAEERARLVIASPLRAEDEILRIQYSRLKKRVADLEAREAQRMLDEPKRENRIEPTGSNKCRSTDEVWFTTLAEVSVEPGRGSSTPPRAGEEDDQLDVLMEKLFAEALFADVLGSETFTTRTT